MIFNILSKLKIISKLPRGIAKLLLNLIITFDEIFWRLRIFLFTLFLPKTNKFKKAMIELKNNGVSVIPNFYSIEETSNIKNECIKELDKLPFDKLDTNDYIPNLDLDSGLRVEKLKGSIKLKGLQKINNYLYKVTHNIKCKLITFVYQLTTNKPFLIYNVVHDGSFNHPSVPEACGTEMIAGQAHVDLSVHQLRCAIALEDIEKDNGPTVCYKKSMHLKEIKQNHLNMALEKFNFEPESGGGHNITKDKLKFLEAKADKTYVTCKKGDLLLLDLKSVHLATSLKSGQRHILWYYY